MYFKLDTTDTDMGGEIYMSAGKTTEAASNSIGGRVCFLIILQLEFNGYIFIK